MGDWAIARFRRTSLSDQSGSLFAGVRGGRRDS